MNIHGKKYFNAFKYLLLFQQGDELYEADNEEEEEEEDVSELWLLPESMANM